MENKENPVNDATKNGASIKAPLSGMVKDQLMKQAFGILKSQGANSVEGILKYLKERNLLSDATEKIARHVLSGVSDPKNITYDKFAEVCESVAKEKGWDMENISKSVASSLFGEVDGSAESSPGTSAPAPAVVGDSSARADSVQHKDEGDFNEQADDSSESSDEQHDSGNDHHESPDDHIVTDEDPPESEEPSSE